MARKLPAAAELPVYTQTNDEIVEFVVSELVKTLP
jgi:hypothetical protein